MQAPFELHECAHWPRSRLKLLDAAPRTPMRAPSWVGVIFASPSGTLNAHSDGSEPLRSNTQLNEAEPESSATGPPRTLLPSLVTSAGTLPHSPLWRTPPLLRVIWNLTLAPAAALPSGVTEQRTESVRAPSKAQSPVGLAGSIQSTPTSGALLLPSSTR